MQKRGVFNYKGSMSKGEWAIARQENILVEYKSKIFMFITLS